MTKKKKSMRMLAAVLTLALLGLIYVLVSRAQWNTQEDTQDEEEITVLTVDLSAVTAVKLENSYGTLLFSYDGETWKSEDDPEFALNQEAVTNLFNRLNPLTAVRDLGEAEDDLEEYGLSEPAVTISLAMEDGQEISVSLGAEASDGNLYFMTSESGSIYTGDSYLFTAFDCQLSDLEAEEEEAEETQEETDEAEETESDAEQDAE